MLLEFTLSPAPYQAGLQLILAGSFALLETIIFVFCLLNLKNDTRCHYLIAILILIAAMTFLLGQAFNQHYYAEHLITEFGTPEAEKGDEAILYKLKEFFTISSLMGLILATIVLVLKLWRHQKTAKHNVSSSSVQPHG